MESPVNETLLKELLKEAIIEVIEERKDMLRGLLAEVIEDVALGRAILEGEQTEAVSREEIFRLLNDQA